MKMAEAHCKECHTVFKKKRDWQKFCSPVCRTKHFVRTRNEEVAFARQIKSQSKPDLFSNAA
jgi:uncharacterized Zn finger protein (UPF0148 family)